MKKVTLLVAILVAAGAFFGRSEIAGLVDSLSGAPTPQPSMPTDSVHLLDAPPIRTRMVLLDPTTSTDASFREAMKALLVANLQTYVPNKPQLTKDGVSAVTGLNLAVRLVGTLPLQHGAPIYTVSIPSVAELSPRPDMTAAGALDPGGPYDLWKEAEASWSTQYDAAIRAAEQGSELLGEMNLDLDEQSAISAGVASLTLVAPASGDIAYLVMSDLDENRPQASAAFDGAPILIVQPDPVGDQGRWNALYLAFETWATANGAGQIERVRPEVADVAVTSFIQGGLT